MSSGGSRRVQRVQRDPKGSRGVLNNCRCINKVRRFPRGVEESREVRRVGRNPHGSGGARRGPKGVHKGPEGSIGIRRGPEGLEGSGRV